MHFAWRVRFFIILFFTILFLCDAAAKKKNNSFINTMLRRRRRRWRRKRGSYKMLISWHAHTTCVLPPLPYPHSPCRGQFPGLVLELLDCNWCCLFCAFFELFYLIFSFFHIISHIYFLFLSHFVGFNQRQSSMNEKDFVTRRRFKKMKWVFNYECNKICA